MPGMQRRVVEQGEKRFVVGIVGGNSEKNRDSTGRKNHEAIRGTREATEKNCARNECQRRCTNTAVVEQQQRTAQNYD